ncbi:hypothetical protein C0991_007652 [Blastosporella zonata]|nr:hypothetical protein C0991_007652 [Blastosporella zonata]
MKEFSEVTYDAESQTAVIGAGLAWDKVYAALAPYGVNVVGGRVKGVGVAGFLLGGGYSWLTNQRGLGVDNIVAYELVKPTGEIGIVTRFVLKAYPQQDVWGGVITFTLGQVPDVTAATANFSALVTDPKASIITTYNYVLGQLGVALILFYDAPTPPTGIFDEFLSIPAFTKGVSTRSFLSLVKATPVNTIQGQRVFHDAIRQSASRIRQAAASEEGQAIVGEAAVYPNYAHFDTPLEGLYGANLQRLRNLRHVVDPENVMGLAGGFRI